MGACMSKGGTKEGHSPTKNVQKTNVVQTSGGNSELSSVSETDRKSSVQKGVKVNNAVTQEGLIDGIGTAEQTTEVESICHTEQLQTGSLSKQSDAPEEEISLSASDRFDLAQTHRPSDVPGDVQERLKTNISNSPKSESGPTSAHHGMIVWDDVGQTDAQTIFDQIHATSLQVQEEDVYVSDLNATQPEIVVAM